MTDELRSECDHKFDYRKDEIGEYRVCESCKTAQRKIECWEEVSYGF